MGIFLILAVVFFVLWLLERRKVSAQASVMETKQSANMYAAEKRAEADSLYEEKHREALDYYWKKTKSADERYDTRMQELEALQSEKADLQSELDILSRNVLCSVSTIDAYPTITSDEIKNKLALLKSTQDDLVKSDGALIITNVSAAKRIIDSQKKQILRCFNSESVSLIDSVTAKNVDSIRTKLQRSYEALNKIFDVDGVQISQDFFALKLEELSLVYSYMLKVEEEREQKKAIREQMLEEDKVRREIEREKEKIEKEESQFNNEVNKLMSYMQKAKDDIEKQLYIEKIQALEEKLKGLAADKEHVLEREQNTRAGFVYIISNIGSFGEHIYKIGMTRRLEPMDRINELGSASVPFPFDVHALIFSADAPALETLLHHHFQSQQVNKVNSRKEFFRVNLDEIKQLVIKNHNSTAQFIDVPDAAEYRETLRIEQSQKA